MVAVNYDWDEIEDNIDEEYDDSGAVVAEYTTEPDLYGNVVSQRRSGQSSFLHCDGLGSNLALTNATGTVTDTRSYTAFGETTEQSGSTVFPFHYVGQQQYYDDNTGAETSVRLRTYAPQSGRWLSFDLHPQCARSTFAYVLNSTPNATDPSGAIILWCAHQVDRAKCAICARAVGLEVLIELRINGIDINDWANGGRAFLHCMAVCRSSRLCRGSCLYWWQAREQPLDTVADQMGYHNNTIGDSCAFAYQELSCFECCMNNWKAGDLKCQRGAPPYSLDPCPPPANR